MPTRDERFLAQIRELPCLACGRAPTEYAPTEAHHIQTRGAGGGDDWWNVLPLCNLHHTKGGRGVSWHAGRFSFLRMFPHVELHLRKLGWHVDAQAEQLFRPVEG